MSSEQTRTVPGTARVVIVGGGIMGCGLAYHLAHEGWTDIVLLEKGAVDVGFDLARGRPDYPFDLELLAWANASTTTSACIPAQLEK